MRNVENKASPVKVIFDDKTYYFVGNSSKANRGSEIKQFIFPDDTIACVAEKLCKFIPGLSGPVFIWARSTVADPSNLASSFALNLLRGRSFVHRSEALRSFANISGGKALTIPTGRDMLNVLDIIASVPKDWRTIDEPASVKHVEKGYPIYTPTNPGRLTPEQIALFHQALPSAFDNGAATLESLGNGGQLELHVIGQQAVIANLTRQPETLIDRIIQIYFTNHMAPRSQDDLTVHELLFSGGVKDVQLDTYLLRLSLVHNQHSLSHKLDLSNVLDRLALSSTLPFVCLKDANRGGSIFYRIHRRSFSLHGNVMGTLAIPTLRSWMDQCKKYALSDETTLIAYSQTKNGIVFSIQISVMQASQIHFAFASAQSVQTNDISNCVDDVNACIRNLHAAGVDALLPIDRQFLLGLDPGQLFTSKYGANMSTTQQTPTVDRLSAVVRSRLSDIFVIVPPRRGDRGNVLTLQYKRYDNYNEGDAVHKYIDMIASNNDEDSASWPESVAAAFNLDRESAIQAIDDWRAKSEIVRFGRGIMKLWYLNGIYVQVTRNSDVGISYTVTGISRWQQASRIDCAMQHLLSYTTTGKALRNSAEIRVTDDPDKELLADLRQDLALGPATESSVKKEGYGYVLKTLRKADEKLFKSGFAGLCTSTSRRQPVVVEKTELEASRKLYPGAFTEYVQTGSTPELAKKNYYICPYVWCPKSRIALSKLQFENLGKRCPIMTVQETPIIMDSPYFKGQPHHAQLMDASRHPDGLAMPCCFKHNKDQLSEKVSYIQAGKFPAPQGRYAVLPASLTSLLAGGPCGNRADGSGNLGNNTKCYVRMGMPPSDQPFLQCIAELWKITIEDLVNKMIRYLDISSFLALERGDVCISFLDAAQNTADPQRAPTYSEFSAWFPKQSQYIQKFRLQHILSKLKDKSTLRSDDLHREFSWYASMNAFKAYLADVTVMKTPMMVLDLVMRCQNATLLIVDVNNDNSIVMPCNRTPRNSSSVFMIVRKGLIFEPIYRVSASSVPVAKHRLPLMMAAQSKYCESESSFSLVAKVLQEDPSAEITQILDSYLRLVAISIKYAGSRSKAATIIQMTKVIYGFEPSIPGTVMYAKNVPEFKNRALAWGLNQRISTRQPVADEHSIWNKDLENEQQLTESAIHTLEQAVINFKETQDHMYYLRHPMNPLSQQQRLQIFRDLLGKLVSSELLKDAAVRHLMLGTMSNLPLARSTAQVGTILLTDDDVSKRSHRELFALLKTPYTTVDIDVPKVLRDVSRKVLDIPIHLGKDLPAQHFGEVNDQMWKVSHAWKLKSRLASSIFLSITVGAVQPGVRLPAKLPITLETMSAICKLFNIGIVLASSPTNTKHHLASKADTWIVIWMDVSMTKQIGVLTSRRDEIIWTSDEIQADLTDAGSSHKSQAVSTVGTLKAPHNGPKRGKKL